MLQLKQTFIVQCFASSWFLISQVFSLSSYFFSYDIIYYIRNNVKQNRKVLMGLCLQTADCIYKSSTSFSNFKDACLSMSQNSKLTKILQLYLVYYCYIILIKGYTFVIVEKNNLKRYFKEIHLGIVKWWSQTLEDFIQLGSYFAVCFFLWFWILLITYNFNFNG